MLTFIYDQNNGLSLPDNKWEDYIAGIFTQYNASETDMTVILGNSLPFDIITVYIRRGATYYKNVRICDAELYNNSGPLDYDMIPVDSDGYAMKHTTIGKIQQTALMDMF